MNSPFSHKKGFTCYKMFLYSFNLLKIHTIIDNYSVVIMLASTH